MRHLITFLLLCTLFTGTAFSQVFKEFSGQDAFLEELNQQLQDRSVGDAKKEHKELMEKFTEMWVELNAFTPEQKNRIFVTSNNLLGNKMKVLPEVRDYVETVVALIDVKITPTAFNEWHRTVDNVIDSRSARKNFSNYMKFSTRLFTEQVLYSTGSVAWYTDNNSFRFEMEDEQPKLVVPSLTLECKAKGSYARITGTSGVLYPLEGEWIGKNGTVTWEKAGLNPNKVYAIINNYEIKMKFSNYDADSVTFYNTDYFDRPLLGRLQDKVQAVVNEDRSSFPTFVSYSRRLKISNIDRGVDYEGGFTQQGSRFLASGSDEDPAYLVFYLNEKPFLEVKSISFSIKEDKITTTNGSIKFTLHDDSITHPGLDFKFFRNERMITLFRADEGLQKAPYFDSYHAIDIYTELVTWKIDQPTIFFGTIPNSSDNRAFFESDYYFRENRFDQLQGLSMDHPLVIVKNCFTQTGLDRLEDKDIARCFRSGITDVQVMLLTYTNMGLVSYDPRTGWVTATDRLYHYIAAKSELEDYDVIQIGSDIGTMENASMDLVDEVFTLKINGIRNIIVSDSHQVNIRPLRGTITMKKNRDFDFSGKVEAGRVEFYGYNFEFVYDDFKLEMPNIDSMRFIVSTGEETKYGTEKFDKVKTVIEDVKGTLEIDQSNNKAGLEQLEQYPIFTSHETSYAFYDRSSIQDKAYLRDNFYFELEPFVFDSLDDFGNERLSFDGTFKSADIFPEFQEKLTLQEDNSLGFIRETPSDGFEVYRGKGRYYQTIKMSHEGLRGDGKLKYLTSTSKSEDFLFLPEQMQTTANSFVIEEKMGSVQYPPTVGNDIKQTWDPYDDRLLAESTKSPFEMYDGSKLTGSLTLTPDDLTGQGLFAFEKAELESNLFRFQFSDFQSDTADFRLKGDVNAFEGFQFKTNNVKANIDFAKRKGEFISNDGTSMMEFPQNEYVAFMDRFTWLMDEEAIELSGGKQSKSTAAGTMQFEGSRFISIKPAQDSLEFYSPAARYDIRNSIIAAREVEFIQVADALIYPDSGLVTVLKKAKMKTLVNCRIVANAITKYHKIDSATVDIFARRDYVGTGLYNYKDKAGTQQIIRFSTVGVDSSYQTYATGTIAEERAFTLSPYFDYKGDVRLEASTKDLSFSGVARVTHQCEASIPRTWFKFKAALDPDEIYIPIDQVVLDEEDNKLTNAIVLDPDTGAIYSSFLSTKRQDKDVELLPASGYLVYNENEQEYQISNANKLVQQSLPGQYLSLKSADCNTFGMGKLGFGINTGQVDLTTVGNIKHDLKTDKVELDVMLLVDFFFDDKLIDDMGKVMAENAVGDPTDFERDVYQVGLRELIGTDDADKLISAITLTGQFKRYPSELEKRMFLTDVKMKWNPETSSYQSEGGKIGIGNIGKRQVNVRVNGKVEVVVGRIPEINIYLEADKDTWYYFRYVRNTMQAYSSIEEFNTTIAELKSDKRKMKVERGQAPYSFMPSSKRRKDDFISRF